MSIEITTQLIHASYASVIRTIDENANIYDNPNQQGTYYPAWFIVHRSPVELQKGIGRWTLVYQIDIWYMLKSNQTRLYDQYSAIAEQLDDKLEYLPIFGTDACVHVLDRSWGLELDALKYSTTLRLYASRGPKPVIPYMEVIEDLRVFLKGLKQEFYTLSFTNTEHPDFTVELPDDIVVSANAFVKLPSVSGKHTEDEETWVTSRWDIGEFGSSVKMDEDKVANLLWEELQQFVVSFANTTYPQFDVDLPEQAVVIAGESITLPSVSGQFVEDGYVYTPSGWDIGDFGSEFTPTGNTIANLIFNAEKQYEEIKLYLPSGNKQAQKQVTSGFTGNVSATYCYQLYTDEQLTTPWTGYDYSNTYEFGTWRDGVWVPTATQKISDLPDTYTSDSTQWKMAFILMDNGFLWLASNASGSGYMSYPSEFITLRIYPKGETVFAMYPVKTSSMGIYDNKSISTGGQNMQWNRGTAGSTQGGVNFPTMLVNGVYKSGAIFDQSLVSRARVWSSGGNDSTIRASSTSSFSCNAITFTFEQPIYKAWFNADHTDETNSTLGYLPKNTNHTLYDEVGDTIDFEDDCTYTPCLVFIARGSANGNMYINSSQSLVSNDNNHLAYKYTNGTLSKACYVLYTKKYGIDIDVNFGDPVTIPEGYRVESVKCSKLFVKASNVTGDDVTREINFEYLGEKLFCTDKNKTWFGAKVSPVIEMFGFSNPSTFGGFRLSCYTTNNTGYAASVSASEFNSGGYFVKGKAVLGSSYTASTYAGYMQTNPMMFRLYSGGNVLAEYHFTIQNSVWSFQKGVFSWVGDDTDYSDLAYWYKSAPGVRIHCVKI